MAVATNPRKLTLEEAIAAYGPRVRGVANRYEGELGREYSGRELLADLTQGESGNRGDRTSSAGAKGFTQFMPGTRQAVLQATGGEVDPWRSPGEAVFAATMHLRGELGHAKGLEGYNPGGGQGYVDYIIGQDSRVPGSAGGAGGALPSRISGVPAELETGAGALASLLAQPQAPAGPPVGALQAPEFAARPVTPEGYQPVQSAGAPQRPTAALEQTLAAIRELPGQSLPEAQERAGAGGRGGGGGAAGPVGYPLATPGKIIGTPHAGTHNLGNWQSDNAVDISAPNGTPVQSLEDGVVEKVRGSYEGGASRFDGYQITVRFADGNRAFYTHLSEANVKPGDRVAGGSVIGLSGSANGVPHLHLGVEKGDPRKLIGGGRR